jgi:drug/metabolite transporter, DME family
MVGPTMTDSRETSYGPWLVALGTALWGTESAWRIPLNDRFPADVIVFWEHVILVLFFLPMILPRLGELRKVSKRALGSLVFSGVAGSAVGTVFFTLALKLGNPTVANVILNLQPVLSTTAACLLFGDRLGKNFLPWAALAVVGGVVLSLADLHNLGIDVGVVFALLCALFWGLSTVAGRGVMMEMSMPLAAGLRMVVGLVAMTIIVGARGLLTPAALWPATASADAFLSISRLLLLSVLSGGIPLMFYFAGLRHTRASTAGYFEMMQTLAGATITWVVFHHALALHQVIAGIVVFGAVAMVQRAPP